MIIRKYSVFLSYTVTSQTFGSYGNPKADGGSCYSSPAEADDDRRTSPDMPYFFGCCFFVLRFFFHSVVVSWSRLSVAVFSSQWSQGLKASLPYLPCFPLNQM